MLSRGSKIFCLDGNFVSDKLRFIQIRDRISASKNKSRKSNITNVRNIYKRSDKLNYIHKENNLPQNKIIKYAELSFPDVHLKLRQHIRGNPLKYDTAGMNCFIQDPICVNERKIQCGGMEQTFLISEIIPDG
jgi:hypothetical protein